ncbi:type VI secretion system baseplate subunit TssG [Paraburkholderia sp.]|uniref:type VI secretion system baseplate subunit TssG n=1 Tax=Paraburkholderia sp. TaxID=1926495 RepID=UPI002D713EEC|nr:type VI secretion system baseplate subunit TssG [Paraburkholderia sp.]HZZ06517.1 type VI secretion system baseplate subunit TssG [Paraburkholderia sp.]
MSNAIAHSSPEPHPGRTLDQFWQRVADAPYEYDLYTLLRWLDARAGGPSPLGRATHPADEPLRIGQAPSLAFAPATLAAATAPADNKRPRVLIHSFGLFGPNGPLPLHLTELVRERARHHDDHALSAFANLFHHRLILLFYRAWADAQPTVSLDRGDGGRFDRYLASLIHLGWPSGRRPDALSDHARYFMAGHLVRQTRNPEGLRSILRAYLGVAVEIVEWIPHWLPVEAPQRTALRTRADTRRLGAGAILGVAVRDAQTAFQIRLGPLSHEQYVALLPGTQRSQLLTDWVRQYAGLEWSWSVRLLMAADQVAGTALAAARPLGLASWLGRRTSTLAASDLVYQPETRATAPVTRAQPGL